MFLCLFRSPFLIFGRLEVVEAQSSNRHTVYLARLSLLFNAPFHVVPDIPFPFVKGLYHGGVYFHF